MKVCALAPAYNEIAHIAGVVRGCRRHCPVVVVDDGSTDGTARAAEQAGARVLRRAVNSGKGVALRMGFAHVLNAGWDAVVTLDGDGQHDPADVPRLVAAAERRPSLGIVVGSRMHDTRAMPLSRRASGRCVQVFSVQTSRRGSIHHLHRITRPGRLSTGAGLP